MKDVDITGLRYDCVAARHEGHVALELSASDEADRVHMHFLCHSRLLQDCCPKKLREELIADALRQVGRMPGFRRGERRITLPDAMETSA
ncbi:MAG: hypothetical protein P8X77_11775 [Maritimibacter sp.]